jgi:hypothetical protein
LEPWNPLINIAADGPEVLLNAMSFVEHHVCTSEGIHLDHTTGFLASKSLVAVSFSYEAFSVKRWMDASECGFARFQFQTALDVDMRRREFTLRRSKNGECGSCHDTHRPSRVRRIVEGNGA